GEPHARGDALLAQRGQQHEQRADPGEDQEEEERDLGRPADRDHGATIMRSTIWFMNIAMVAPAKGSASSMVTKMAMILGTKTRVISWIWVRAWNSAMMTPTTSPTTIMGADTMMSVQMADCAISRVNSPVMAGSGRSDSLRSVYAPVLRAAIFRIAAMGSEGHRGLPAHRSAAD